MKCLTFIFVIMLVKLPLICVAYNPLDFSHRFIYAPKINYFNRRSWLKNIAWSFLVSSVAPSVNAEESSLEARMFSKYVDKESAFEVKYPVTWTLLPRKANIMSPPFAQKPSTGTVLVVGDFLEGLEVSITCSDIRQLLKGAGFDNTGRLEKISDIGKPIGVADLLLRQRDGILETKNPMSRVKTASSEGNILNFVAETIVTLAMTGGALSASDLVLIKPNIKTTFGRSFLRNNGNMITVWASSSYREGTKFTDQVNRIDLLNELVDSFKPLYL